MNIKIKNVTQVKMAVLSYDRTGDRFWEYYFIFVFNINLSHINIFYCLFIYFFVNYDITFVTSFLFETSFVIFISFSSLHLTYKNKEVSTKFK